MSGVFFIMFFPYKFCLLARHPKLERLFHLPILIPQKLGLCCVSLKFVQRKQIFDGTAESVFVMAAVFVRLTLMNISLTFLRE